MVGVTTSRLSGSTTERAIGGAWVTGRENAGRSYPESPHWPGRPPFRPHPRNPSLTRLPPPRPPAPSRLPRRPRAIPTLARRSPLVRHQYPAPHVWHQGGQGWSSMVPPRRRCPTVTMSIRRMTLGAGYRYLMSSVARIDEATRASGLTAYYVATGTPPGWFLGAGLAGLDGGAASSRARGSGRSSCGGCLGCCRTRSLVNSSGARRPGRGWCSSTTWGGCAGRRSRLPGST